MNGHWCWETKSCCKVSSRFSDIAAAFVNACKHITEKCLRQPSTARRMSLLRFCASSSWNILYNIDAYLLVCKLFGPQKMFMSFVGIVCDPCEENPRNTFWKIKWMTSSSSVRNLYSIWPCYLSSISISDSLFLSVLTTAWYRLLTQKGFIEFKVNYSKLLIINTTWRAVRASEVASFRGFQTCGLGKEAIWRSE